MAGKPLGGRFLVKQTNYFLREPINRNLVYILVPIVLVQEEFEYNWFVSATVADCCYSADQFKAILKLVVVKLL